MTHHIDDDHHIARCAICQARFSTGVPVVDFARVWARIVVGIHARPIGWVERVAARLLRSPGLARALVMTPSLVLAWTLASAAVLGLGVVLSYTSGTPWVALLAPALAGIAIAYVYGPGTDPAFELCQTTPISDRMILLVRSLAVFGLNAGLGLIGIVCGAPSAGITLTWLVPMTAVSALALAVAALARSPQAGVAVALGSWAGVVIVAAAATHDLAAAVMQRALLPLYSVITLVCIALVVYAAPGQSRGRVRWH